MFPYDSCQSTQGFVDLSRTCEHSGYIGLKDHNHTARCVARRIFVRPSVTEVVLRKYLVDIDPADFFNSASRSLHALSVHDMSRIIFYAHPCYCL